MTDDLNALLARMPELPAYDLTRIRVAISEAIDELDEDDMDYRIAYCREHDEHGVRVEVDSGVLRFSWGSRPLFKMPLAALARYGATPAEMS